MSPVIDVYPVGIQTLRPVSDEVLPDDPDGQVEKTLGHMVRLACADSSSPEILRDVKLAMRCGANPLDGIHAFIRARMSFVTDDTQTQQHTGILPGPDHYFVEALTRPRDVSQLIATTGRAQGDCDDFSMYCAAMLCALKIPCSFCTVAASSAAPRDYSHVYVVAYPDGQRVPMDCSHGPSVGWETPNRLGRRREWPVCSGQSGKMEAVITLGVAIALVALFRFTRGWM